MEQTTRMLSVIKELSAALSIELVKFLDTKKSIVHYIDLLALIGDS